ncbi:Uncharacterized protein Fot_35295 [Forsythia ovata]|uniref:Uncharacterized protein n=1 Tax=Forsythia ovata TaxID=205694 RepID=A0ABD1SL42_9LAMI
MGAQCGGQFRQCAQMGGQFQRENWCTISARSRRAQSPHVVRLGAITNRRKAHPLSHRAVVLLQSPLKIAPKSGGPNLQQPRGGSFTITAAAENRCQIATVRYTKWQRAGEIYKAVEGGSQWQRWRNNSGDRRGAGRGAI